MPPAGVGDREARLAAALRENLRRRKARARALAAREARAPRDGRDSAPPAISPGPETVPPGTEAKPRNDA